MAAHPNIPRPSLKDQLFIFVRIARGQILASPRRSLLTLLLIMVTTALLIFFLSMMNGSHNKLKSDSVEVYTGYLRVQGKGFQKRKNPENWIYSSAAVLEKVRDHYPQERFTRRLESFALFSSDHESQGAMLIGIEPGKEAQFSRVFKNLVEGEMLTPSSGSQVLIGSQFSKKLKAKIGDTIAFVGASLDSSIAAELVTVRGIFRTGFREIDSNMIFTSLGFLQQALLADDVISHLIINPVDTSNIELRALQARTILRDLPVEVIPWTEELSHLIQTLDFDRVSGYFRLSILLIIIFFVLLIYAQLSILTRTREIGVLRALGTSPFQILSILGLETAFLGVLGGVAGVLIGGSIALYFQVYPMQFPSFEEAIAQYGFADASLPTLFEGKILIQGFLTVFAMHLCSAVHPMLKVTFLRPVEALNTYA